MSNFFQSIACVYVFSDHILSQQVPGPSPIRVCSYVGAYCSVLSILWILGYTLPRFDELIHVNPEVSMQSVFGMYGLLILASATHAWNYYELIGRTGNVSVEQCESSVRVKSIGARLALWPFAQNQISNPFLCILGRNWYSSRLESHSGVWLEPFLVLQLGCSSMLYSMERMGQSNGCGLCADVHTRRWRQEGRITLDVK